MAALTKSDILQGIDDPKLTEIKSLGGELWLRPLSSAELDEVDRLEAKAMGTYETNEKSNIQGKRIQQGESVQKGKINLEKAFLSRTKSKYMMILKSLDNIHYEDDPWTQQDLDKLKRYQIDEILVEVQKLSGIDVTKKDIDSFPENEGS